MKTPSSSPVPLVAVRRPPRDQRLTYVVLTALLLVIVAWNAHKAHGTVTLLDFGDFRIFHRAAESYLAGESMYPLESASKMRTSVAPYVVRAMAVFSKNAATARNTREWGIRDKDLGGRLRAYREPSSELIPG